MDSDHRDSFFSKIFHDLFAALWEERTLALVSHLFSSWRKLQVSLLEHCFFCFPLILKSDCGFLVLMRLLG